MVQQPLPPPGERELVDGRVVLDAALLKSLRRTRGISQEALAELCFQRQMSVSIASIKRAETGRPVLYRTARHLAAVFGVELETLSGAAKTPNAPSIPAPPIEAPADIGTSEMDERHVVQLHVVLARGGDEAEALMQQFGGVRGCSDGDAALVHFGLPQAYTSDAERALLCALALRDNGYVAPGRAASLRLVRLGDGRPMHAAAYDVLATPAATATKAVLVARNLVARLAARFDFAEGMPQQAFLQCVQPRPLGAGMLHHLCGRLVETQQFKGVIAVTQECQDGHVVYLRGMAGIGKTRLVAEFADIARQSEFAVHQAHVLDFGMDTWFAPLGQLARSVLGFMHDPVAPGEWERALAPLPSDCELFLPLLAGTALPAEKLASYAAMNQAARVHGIVTALHALLLHAGLQRPLLVSIEDLHWGDTNLFDALGKLLARTDEVPVVWLLSSRHEGDPLDTWLRPAVAHPLTLMELGGMRPRDAQALAEQFPDVESTHRAQCIERARGNPLYLTQLLADPAHALPDSLRHLIQARVDRLPAAHQRALRVAAVMGNRFELDLLRDVLQQPDYRPDRTHYLVREIESGSYGFVHDLVMHCVYDAIPDAARSKLHLQVAQVYRGRNAALFAQHLLRGGDPAAFDAVLAAMREKLRLYQYDGVIELAQQGETLASRAAASFDFALLRGRAHAGLGATATARQHLQLALQLARTPRETIAAVLALAPVLNMLDLLHEEQQLIDTAVPLARALGDDAALARLFLLQGNIWFPRGDYARCRQFHEASLRHAHLAADVEAEARATSGIGDSHYAEGDMQRAADVFERCIGLGRTHGLLNVEGSNLSARSSAAFYLGRPQLAMHDAMEGLRCSQRAGDRRGEIFARVGASWVLAAGGNHAEAMQHLALALPLAQAAGAARFEALVDEGLARMALQANDMEAAARHIGEAVALVEKHGMYSFVGPWIYGTLGLVAATEEERCAALLRGQQLLDDGALAHNLLRFYVAAAESALLASDFAAVRHYCAQMQARAHAGSETWVKHHAHVLLEAAAWREAPAHEARRRLDNAHAAASALGFAWTMPRLRALALATNHDDAA